MSNKSYFRPGVFSIILCLGYLFPVNTASAADLEDALAASQAGDNETAFSIFKQLAVSGDKLAQYNLALFYKQGIAVASSQQLADYWFAQSAQNGVVDGYEQLASTGIRPGKSTHVDLVFGPQEWIRAQNSQDYTLQLASSSNLRLIERYYNEYQMQGRGGYFLNKKQGRYALVYGVYASVADASAAIKDLPDELRKWSPWVRQLRQVQKNMADSQ